MAFRSKSSMYRLYIKNFHAAGNNVVTRDFVLCLFTAFMSVFQMRNFNDGSAQSMSQLCPSSVSFYFDSSFHFSNLKSKF